MKNIIMFFTKTLDYEKTLIYFGIMFGLFFVFKKRKPLWKIMKKVCSYVWKKIKLAYYRIITSEKINDIAWKIGFMYETNNNIWLMIWPIFIFHLLFNMLVFGIGPEIYSANTSDMFLENAYNNYLGILGQGGFGELPWYLKIWNFWMIVWIRSVLAWISWKACLLEFIASIFVVWVLRDEVQEAYRRADKIVRERRNKRIEGGEAKDTKKGQILSSPAQAPQQFGAQTMQQPFFQRPLSLRSFFFWDLAIELLQQLGFIRRIHQI